MRAAVLLAIASAAILAGTASADVALIPQDWFGGPGPSHARLVTRPAFRSIRLGELVIDFEKTRLKDVLAKAVVGTIRTQGDAAESETWLCYRFYTERGVAQIDLTSGELGGGERISGVVLRDGKLEGDKQCPELPATLMPIATDVGPGLGSRYEDFARVLGKPTERSAARTSWEFEQQTRIADSPELWFIDQGIHAHFKGGLADIVLFVQTTQD
jgi:hypothetical protein